MSVIFKIMIIQNIEVFTKYNELYVNMKMILKSETSRIRNSDLSIFKT